MASPDPRQNIERFLAAGGGSFAYLLDMVGAGQPPEVPPPGTDSQTPAWLPTGYRLERAPDVLRLSREDGSLVAAFSAREVTVEAIVRAVEEDRRGLPGYFGPEEYADSVRRLVETWIGHSWQKFLQVERRTLKARGNGELARALAYRLPGESQEELDGMASEERGRAEKGLVELRDERGKLSYKHIEQLSPEDRMDRIRAELARMVWLLERQGRRNILRPTLGQRHSRKSRTLAEASETNFRHPAPRQDLASVPPEEAGDKQAG